MTGLTAADVTARAASPRLPRGWVLLTGAAAAVVLAAGLHQVAGVFAPAFLAFVLTICVQPLTARLRVRGAPLWVCALVAVSVVYGFIVLVTVLVAVAAGQFVELVPTYSDQLAALAEDVRTWLERRGLDREQARAVTGGVDAARIREVVSGLLGGAASLVSSMVFVLALVLFASIDTSRYASWLRAAPAGSLGLVRSFGLFAVRVRRYSNVSTVFGTVVAVLDWLFLWAIGIPGAALWGVLAFVTNYIPNVGFVIGLVPPAVLGYLEGGPGTMALIVAVYIVINVVIQSVIQPKVVGDAVQLSMTVTFLSVVLWTFLLGGLGAVLAVPLTLFLKAFLIDADSSARWLRLMLGDPTDHHQHHGPDQPAPRHTTIPTNEGAIMGIRVNVDNFVRAETARMLADIQDGAGGVNTFRHNREPAPIEEQTVIRLNRDTFYSFAVVDLAGGGRLTMPDPGERYVSVMVVNEDHLINEIHHGAGTFELSADRTGSRYALLAVRTLVDPEDPDDIAAVSALQDQYRLELASSEPFEMPDYDAASMGETRDALLQLARGLEDLDRMFGTAEEIDPVRHLIGTAAGWGGLPTSEAVYVGVDPRLSAGTYAMTFRDTPVDAFWSVSVYNAQGFFEPNGSGTYTVNSVTGTPSADGSVTVHFVSGDDLDGLPNAIHTPEDWNLLIRLYRPRPEVFDGSWTPPQIVSVGGPTPR